MGITSLILQACSLLILSGLGIGGWILFKRQEEIRTYFQTKRDKVNILTTARVNKLNKLVAVQDEVLDLLDVLYWTVICDTRVSTDFVEKHTVDHANISRLKEKSTQYP